MASTKDFYGRAFPRPSALVAADGSIQRDHPHALRKVVPRDKGALQYDSTVTWAVVSLRREYHNER